MKILKVLHFANGEYLHSVLPLQEKVVWKWNIFDLMNVVKPKSILEIRRVKVFLIDYFKIARLIKFEWYFIREDNVVNCVNYHTN